MRWNSNYRLSDEHFQLGVSPAIYLLWHSALCAARPCLRLPRWPVSRCSPIAAAHHDSTRHKWLAWHQQAKHVSSFVVTWLGQGTQCLIVVMFTRRFLAFACPFQPGNRFSLAWRWCSVCPRRYICATYPTTRCGEQLPFMRTQAASIHPFVRYVAILQRDKPGKVRVSHLSCMAM